MMAAQLCQVSVIVPTFNVERYVAECLESVLSQDFEGAYELIVVDDGSTDMTPALVEGFARRDDRIRFFQVSHDGAPGKARNRGIEEAQGDYLVFLDSDDRLRPRALASFNDVAQAHQPDVICGDRVFIDELSASSGHRPLPPTLRGLREHAGELDLELRQVYANASAKAYRRAIVTEHQIRFPEGHPGQDSGFSVTFCAYARSIFGLDTPVYDVRVRGDAANPSLTQQFDLRAVGRRLTSARQCVDELCRRGLDGYAADARAYFLLGILLRLVQENARGRLTDIPATYELLKSFRDSEARRLGARMMSPQVRRRWRVASCVMLSPWSMRLALGLAKLLGVGRVRPRVLGA